MRKLEIGSDKYTEVYACLTLLRKYLSRCQMDQLRKLMKTRVTTTALCLKMEAR